VFVNFQLFNFVCLCGSCYRALQEAHEIFGIDFDFEEFEQYDEDEEEDEIDDEVLCTSYVVHYAVFISMFSCLSRCVCLYVCVDSTMHATGFL